MTLKNIYLRSKQFLLSLGYIKSVELFNNQPSNLSEYKLLQYPAALIELMPGQVHNLPQYAQKIELTFKLHLIQDMLNSDNPNHLDILDYVNQDLSGENLTQTGDEEGILFSPLQLQNIDVDYDHDKVIIHTLTFSAIYLANNIREVEPVTITQLDITQIDTDANNI